MKRITRTCLITAAFVLLGKSVYAQTTEYFSKDAFLAALSSPRVVDFDQLPPNSVMTGTEFASSGLVVTHLDAKEINVISSPPVSCPEFFSTLPNAISSSYSSVQRAGYRAVNCNLWYNNANSDNIRFTFAPTPANAAGIYFGENDVAGVTVRFIDATGNVIVSRFFPAFRPHSGFYGIITSIPIGSMEVSNGAFDEDGMAFDDVIFQIPSPPPSADLSLVKTDSPDPVAVGRDLTYTLTAVNQGPGTATGVTVNDRLPETMAFVSASPQCIYVVAGHTVTCTVGSLSPAMAATLTIVVRPLQGGKYTNTASVSGIEADPDTSNNTVTETTTVHGPPNPPEPAACDLVDLPPKARRPPVCP